MQLLTREQVRRIDRLAIDEYGIPGIVLMENAGRNAAEVVVEWIEELGDEHYFKSEHPRVAILCGGGNNAGDGYVIARHLYNEGIEVALFAAKEVSKLSGDARINADITENMGLVIESISSSQMMNNQRPAIAEADVIIDALLGTGSTGEVRGHFAEIIHAVNELREEGATVVAIDVPSGLDCDTGKAGNATIVADVTVTFVASKIGFTEKADKYTGRIVVADIGAPPQVVAEVLANR
jgi:NAD(P)H-hydrate epimerase